MLGLNRETSELQEFIRVPSDIPAATS